MTQQRRQSSLAHCPTVFIAHGCCPIVVLLYCCCLNQASPSCLLQCVLCHECEAAVLLAQLGWLRLLCGFVFVSSWCGRGIQMLCVHTTHTRLVVVDARSQPRHVKPGFPRCSLTLPPPLLLGGSRHVLCLRWHSAGNVAGCSLADIAMCSWSSTMTGFASLNVGALARFTPLCHAHNHSACL